MIDGMKRKWSHSLWSLALLALLTGGCSGINASRSISPLDFILPGLHLQNDAPELFTPNGSPVLVCWGGDLVPHAIP
jgi:hypothetical protein